MSATQAIAQPETQAAQAPAVDEARQEAPKPEQAVAPEAIAANDGSIAPTGRPVIPNPEKADVAAVVGTAPAANDSMKETATAIEQQLAKYIGERLTAEQAKGLTVDVVLAKSNEVTGTGSSALQELHDIAITIKGPFVSEEQKNASWEGNALAALKQHPAFLALSNDASERIYHNFSLKNGGNTGDNLVLKTYSLDKAALEELLKPQPLHQGTAVTGAAATPEAHACAGANCSHCAASPAKSEDALRIEKALAAHFEAKSKELNAAGTNIDLSGVNIDVALNKTGDANNLSIKLSGGAYTPERADAMKEMLKQHPAFTIDHGTLNIDQVVTSRSGGSDEYSITATSNGVTARQIDSLTNANIAPAPVATLAEQPSIAEVKPEGLATAPVTQVAAPANHKGVAANKDHLAIGA